MKVIRYADYYPGCSPEFIGLTAPEYVTWPIPIGNKRYRIEFELPDPVVDGVVTADLVEVDKP